MVAIVHENITAYFFLWDNTRTYTNMNASVFSSTYLEVAGQESVVNDQNDIGTFRFDHRRRRFNIDKFQQRIRRSLQPYHLKRTFILIL